MPVCVAASHLDGLVMALTPNSHSYNYRSSVLFGHAKVVEDPAERLYAMELITNGVIPGSWSNTRVPPNKAELSSTSVLKVTIEAGSAKVRFGPPGDEKHDRDDAEAVNKVWTGVVPRRENLLNRRQPVFRSREAGPEKHETLKGRRECANYKRNRAIEKGSKQSI
ncbi:hypothetical protein COL154_005245 [Colletotrichum chrysophilum]|nr:hypothetical protein COL154_005245 [Colletotrichum chrysophilum]